MWWGHISYNQPYLWPVEGSHGFCDCRGYNDIALGLYLWVRKKVVACTALKKVQHSKRLEIVKQFQ